MNTRFYQAEAAGKEHYLQNQTAYHEEALIDVAKDGISIETGRQ